MNYYSNECTWLPNKEVESVQPVQMDMYQRNNHKRQGQGLAKGLRETASEQATVLHTVSVVYLTYPSSSQDYQSKQQYLVQDRGIDL